MVRILQEKDTLGDFLLLLPSVSMLGEILIIHHTVPGTTSCKDSHFSSNSSGWLRLFIVVVETGSSIVNAWWHKASHGVGQLSENFSILDFGRHRVKQMSLLTQALSHSIWHQLKSLKNVLNLPNLFSCRDNITSFLRRTESLFCALWKFKNSGISSYNLNSSTECSDKRSWKLFPSCCLFQL